VRAVFDVSVLIRFGLGSGLVARLLNGAARGDFVLISTDLLATELDLLSLGSIDECVILTPEVFDAKVRNAGP